MPGLNKLGRNPTNDFRISDPSVSSFHAEIFIEEEIIRVRDLGSTNGTFLDDIKIEESLLTPQNILRLGHVRFQLDEVPITPVAAAPAATAAASSAQVDLAPGCTYHSGTRAAYRCENCGGAFCQECIKIVGQGKFGETTICPVCHGQCYPLLEKHNAERRSTLLGRLTQTLKIPFHR